jgi:predicted amidohydrolase
VLICYDAEFPLLGRALMEAGVEILLVPSCTEALSGYSRVRIGAMARALEGQCVVVHSPTVGPAAWSPAVDSTRGGGDLRPARPGDFPKPACWRRATLNAPGWVTAEIDRAAIGGCAGTARFWATPTGRKAPAARGFPSHRQNSLENRALRAHLAATRATMAQQ